MTVTVLPEAAVPQTSHKEIRALTGLRGICALYVVFFHISTVFPFPSLVRSFIEHGYMAVNLFFILSGFVMAMTSAHLFENGLTPENFKHFLRLRLARIYPLFLLVTLLMAGLIATTLKSMDQAGGLIQQLFFNLTLTHAWGLAVAIVPPSWSISTEWAAYLLFPFSAALALKGSPRLALTGTAVAFSLLAAIAFGPYWMSGDLHLTGQIDPVMSFVPGTTLRCLACFYIGLVAFRFRCLVLARTTGLLAGATLILLYFQNTDLLLIPVLAGLIMALSHDKGFVARLLQARWVYWLGVISYALYLIHDLTLKIVFSQIAKPAFQHPAIQLAATVTAVGLSIGMAALCHYGYEKPARLWCRGLGFRGAIKNSTETA